MLGEVVPVPTSHYILDWVEEVTVQGRPPAVTFNFVGSDLNPVP